MSQAGVPCQRLLHGTGPIRDPERAHCGSPWPPSGHASTPAGKTPTTHVREGVQTAGWLSQQPIGTPQEQRAKGKRRKWSFPWSFSSFRVGHWGFPVCSIGLADFFPVCTAYLCRVVHTCTNINIHTCIIPACIDILKKKSM